MELKLTLIFLLVTVAIAAEAYSSEPSWGLNHFNHVMANNGPIGDLIGDENEMLLDSEASRRQLAGGRNYIGYRALRANQIPCGRRGQSYYNCRKRTGKVNPYKRGCNQITRCSRNMGWRRRKKNPRTYMQKWKIKQNNKR